MIYLQRRRSSTAREPRPTSPSSPRGARPALARRGYTHTLPAAAVSLPTAAEPSSQRDDGSKRFTIGQYHSIAGRFAARRGEAIRGSQRAEATFHSESASPRDAASGTVVGSRARRPPPTTKTTYPPRRSTPRRPRACPSDPTNPIDDIVPGAGKLGNVFRKTRFGWTTAIGPAPDRGPDLLRPTRVGDVLSGNQHVHQRLAPAQLAIRPRRARAPRRGARARGAASVSRTMPMRVKYSSTYSRTIGDPCRAHERACRSRTGSPGRYGRTPSRSVESPVRDARATPPGWRRRFGGVVTDSTRATLGTTMKRAEQCATERLRSRRGSNSTAPRMSCGPRAEARPNHAIASPPACNTRHEKPVRETTSHVRGWFPADCRCSAGFRRVWTK